MNSKSICSMLKALFICVLLTYPLALQGKNAKIDINPYFNLYTSIESGYLEFGPEFEIRPSSISDANRPYPTNKAQNKVSWLIRPLFRFSLTDKKNSEVNLNRNTSFYSAILSLERNAVIELERNAVIEKNIKAVHTRYGLQFEWWTRKFSYYPGGDTENKTSEWHPSLALELFWLRYKIPNGSNQKQCAPQFRLRYSRIWKESNKVGVFVDSQSDNPATTVDMIIKSPGTRPEFSFAIAQPTYLGKHNFWITPALFYSLNGKQGKYNPFNSSGRLRFEAWVFYSQWKELQGASRIRIGLSPYISYRTHGDDSLNRIEYGAILQIKYGGNFMKFL